MDKEVPTQIEKAYLRGTIDQMKSELDFLEELVSFHAITGKLTGVIDQRARNLIADIIRLETCLVKIKIRE